MFQFYTYRLLLLLLLTTPVLNAQMSRDSLARQFASPPNSARPWVFWYWMQAAVSKEGITADLEAMKEAGIAGAYLMPIKDTTSPPLFVPSARQLSPEWWALVKFAMLESKRLGLQLAMHVSDGFALAGGPWITPELSMQKLVWSKIYVTGGKKIERNLNRPSTVVDYYKDIKVFAFPANDYRAFNDTVGIPRVTTSNGVKAAFLSFPGDDKQSFRSDSTCWIQYSYPTPVTCRSIRIHSLGNNYQSQRLIVQKSDDGINFTTITRLEPARHGWQDTDEDNTYSIVPTTANHFRFIYNKEDSEPGAEDLDAAKWKPSLKIAGIYLSDEPVINQYESKNGSVWRISANTTKEQVSSADAIPLNKVTDISDKLDSNGMLRWDAPAGNWVVVRIGHTSTGHTNATAGAGKGLECDKFNPVAIKIQFDNWFGKIYEQTDPDLAKEIIKIFHVDSWECGSQNWSPTFRNEFRNRRGYDPLPYLLVMTGVPLVDAATSEKFLHDIRLTIAELVKDVFYTTLHALASEKGCAFSAESVAPTMVSDGLLHYKEVDIPMGEFWLNSPTHDKPNDMLDAIHGGHIYGKNIIQAESFTSVRMNWGEHPGNLKIVGDRNFALGINKLVLHVFTHNPWTNRKPGMTLDGVGLYFQRDQTWFKQSKAWIDYLARCQFLLQQGRPVVDIAVFTGEEIPRRSILPDRLVNALPGIFGSKKVEEERVRLQNAGQPLRSIPDGVSHSANMADPGDWIDPLRGHSYDSFNPDALFLASVSNGRIVLPGGASYAVLVIPGMHRMHPNNKLMSEEVAKKLLQLLKDGAKIVMPADFIGSNNIHDTDDNVRRLLQEIVTVGRSKQSLFSIPFADATFAKINLEKDLEIQGDAGVAWNHRKLAEDDVYYISNQDSRSKSITLNARVDASHAEWWDPLTGETTRIVSFKKVQSRSVVALKLEPAQSLFLVLRKKRATPALRSQRQLTGVKELRFEKPWSLRFDTSLGGPSTALQVDTLRSWTTDSLVKYYSGTATYTNQFRWKGVGVAKLIFLQLDSVYNIASIKINGINCGTVWTAPFQVDISKAVRNGINLISIDVSNTWANRLIGDQLLPDDRRVTWTTAPFRLANKPLLPAGLVGKFYTGYK